MRNSLMQNSILQIVFHFMILLSMILLGNYSQANSVLADGPKDNLSDQVRQVPPVGIELSETDKQELLAGQKKLYAQIETLKKSKDARIRSLIPDVEIFARAIRDGVAHRELFTKRDLTTAKNVLTEGLKRAEALLQGNAPWTKQTGLVVRGYRSQIDHTVQPYGLEIPVNYSFNGKEEYRLDLWFHGRGERSTESLFIAQRMNRKGRFQPRNTIVLHPYGRYSNAFKFAGEIDVLEALEHAKQFYRVDEDRVSVRGFSMGGAGCWQMAVHYPDLFFAANPGAGFSETPEFLKFFQKETLAPTWYEKKLWHMYDCTDNAANLFQLPTIAYSGELDIQKQAADIMEAALKKENLRLTHIIGPGTKHAIHPDSAKIIAAKMENLAKRGRVSVPKEIRFVTYTLKYNRMHWLTVTQLQEHWAQSRIAARLLPAENTIEIDARNVRGIKLNFKAGESPFALDRPVSLVMHATKASKVSDGKQILVALRPETDRSWSCELHRKGNQWQLGPSPANGLQKKHNLQGPIDDAMMSSFLIVKPTGKAWNEKLGQWSVSEQNHFIQEWRRQFRGDAQVVNDTELTAEQIANNHLIFFGDPASNSALAKIIDQLPLKWNQQELIVAGKKYDAAHHAPIMIYPNPANPSKYIVLNSGFTYREFAYLNNARQVPKLPDWAVIDLHKQPDSLWPGKVVDANFFNEQWQYKK